MSRHDRDPNRGNRRVPISTVSAADLLGLNDEPAAVPPSAAVPDPADVEKAAPEIVAAVIEEFPHLDSCRFPDVACECGAAETRRRVVKVVAALAAARPSPDSEAVAHGDACQLPEPWFLRDVGWLADGEISVEDLHQWRIYLGGYDNTQPVPSEACAYRLIHEPNWTGATLRHAPNGLPVWVRAAGDACECTRRAALGTGDREGGR